MKDEMKEFNYEKIPIVEIANEIIIDAVNKGASDIHFDPTKDDLKIRFRIDGILYDYSIVPEKYKRNMISPEFYSYLIKKMYFIALKRLFFCLHL